MRNAAAESAKKTASKNVAAKDVTKDSPKETPLDRRYGAIGISAVAAAVRYQGAAKNPAYAPVVNAWYEPAEEAA
jgi:hypothetical protein